MLVTLKKCPCDVFICDFGGSWSEQHLKDSFPTIAHRHTTYGKKTSSLFVQLSDTPFRHSLLPKRVVEQYYGSMCWQHSLKLRGKSTLYPPIQRINYQCNLNTTQIIALSQKKPHTNSVWYIIWFTWYSRTDKTNTCLIKSGHVHGFVCETVEGIALTGKGH